MEGIASFNVAVVFTINTFLKIPTPYRRLSGRISFNDYAFRLLKLPLA
jgi:hypothetical protein